MPAHVKAEDPAPSTDSVEEPPYRVLIVEDDRTQALFAQSVLHGAGMLAELEMQAENTLDAIARFNPDLILMDLHMPDMDGMHLTALIRQQPDYALLPIVFLTGDPDPELQYEVLDSGADDFLNKPIRPRHLIAAVSNRIRRMRQRQQPQQAPVTDNNRDHPENGLATRAYMLQLTNTSLSQNAPGGLFFIEIASALGLRERYGYAAFERLMNDAGKRLSQLAHPHPLARLNDNSFLMLARDIDEQTLAQCAKGLRESLAQHVFLTNGDEPVHLRSSIGYTALSAAFDDAGMALEATERSALLARLQPDGIAAHVPTADTDDEEHISFVDGQLELAYQPIVAVAGNEQAQYQVLLRLRQPDGTLLPAGQVIPAAETSGLIANLDQQVMEHALGLLAQYRDASPLLRLFVSQSPRTLTRDVFAQWLLDAITSHGISGTSLIIDLRLNDALIHTVTLQDFCKKLLPTGVQFCLSQFEPGREADAVLSQLPLGYIRMSARFAGAHTNTVLRDELREAIDRAHQLGLQVIGQQIEDPQAAAAMWMSGVDYIQGNLVQSVGNDLNFDFQRMVL